MQLLAGDPSGYLGGDAVIETGHAGVLALARRLRVQHPDDVSFTRAAYEGGHMLHGLVAVHLDGGWHRLDPRGNNDRVDARFDLERERLAWPVDPSVGEVDYPEVHSAPAALVVETLRGCDDALALCEGGLPSEL